MDAKKCDRCGKFYVEEKRKADNSIDIFCEDVFKARLLYIGDTSDRAMDLDLCPCCMDDLKNFFEQPSVIQEEK